MGRSRLSILGSSMNPYFLSNARAASSFASTTTPVEAICSLSLRLRYRASINKPRRSLGHESPMVAAADSMPAEKYSFKPTPEMNSFGHVVMHIAQSNYFLCAKISGQAAPDVMLADTDGKDKLVAGLKASFEFCGTALAGVDDSKLGDPLTLFGNRQTSRAGALITLSYDWYDHYGAQAVYLRLNGILPPTAQAAK